jgi:hypothetical protein
MSIITDEQFKQFIDDSNWLQKNYNELIKEFNLEFIAIRNRQVVAHHKEMNEFERSIRNISRRGNTNISIERTQYDLSL